MNKLHLIGTPLLALMLLVSACSPMDTPVPAAAPSAVPATLAAVDTALPANAPAPQVTPSGPATVRLSKNDLLGSFMVDGKNMSLYLFTKDTPNISNCYDRCSAAWPPLLTNGAPLAGDGLDASKLGTIQRKDGSTQVTFNGTPLYYYLKDIKPGDTIGQGINQVWYMLAPNGARVTIVPTPLPTVPATAAPAAPAATTSLATPLVTVMPAAAAADTVMVGKNGALGSFLVDSKNLTLYLFTKDTPNTSNCYDRCAAAWPPLLTTGTPTAGPGLDAAKLGTIQRKDGSLQVTYNSWPLYYYLKDTKPGDTVGQAVNQVWYMVSPQGDQVEPKY